MITVSERARKNPGHFGASLAAMVFAAIIAGVFAKTAQAETLADPTQPPGLDAVSGDAGLPAGPVLQSVMLRSGKKAAMISGQVVTVGEKIGEATLVQVTERSAVLRQEDGAMQTLEMHPAVVKTMIVNKAVVKPPAKKQKAE